MLLAPAVVAAAHAAVDPQTELIVLLARHYTNHDRANVGDTEVRAFFAERRRDDSLYKSLSRLSGSPQCWRSAASILSDDEESLDPGGLLLLALARGNLGRVSEGEQTLRRGLDRDPKSVTLWRGMIEMALGHGRFALALRQIAEARRARPMPVDDVRGKEASHRSTSATGGGRYGRRDSPASQTASAGAWLDFLEARAYAALGQWLGEARVQGVSNGRVGEFHGDWLLVERRPGRDRFLCCPRESALYALRRALDAGLDTLAGHVLYARIWRKVGNADTALAIIRSQETRLRAESDPDVLGQVAEIALAGGDVRLYLHYQARRAAGGGADRSTILHDAYLTAAEHYNQGGDAVLYREFLARAVELRPGDSASVLHLADACWDAGRKKEARRWYTRLLQRDPKHPQRSRILGRLSE